MGLTEGERPDFPFRGHWLYLGGIPVVHLVEAADNAGAWGRDIVHRPRPRTAPAPSTMSPFGAMTFEAMRATAERGRRDLQGTGGAGRAAVAAFRARSRRRAGRDQFPERLASFVIRLAQLDVGIGRAVRVRVHGRHAVGRMHQIDAGIMRAVAFDAGADFQQQRVGIAERFCR